MEYTKDNYDELYDSSLKEGDIVVFTLCDKTYSYRVSDTHLANSQGLNCEIFDDLNIQDTYKYCSKRYGYASYNGSWPAFKHKDFKAATNLVLSLFKSCEIKSKAAKKVTKATKKEIVSYSTERKARLLQYGDKVFFNLPDGKKLEYSVKRNYLEYYKEDNNSILFDSLSLSEGQKYQWAAWGYGEITNSGKWPEFASDNFGTITSWVIDIHEILQLIKDAQEKYEDEDEEIITYHEFVWGIICNYYKNKTPEKLSDKSNLSTNIKLENENGKIIKIQRVTPSVVRGEKRRGHTVQGKNSRTSVTGGYLGYRTITG